MARKRKKAAQAGSPAWMATYSDLMSLLLTFFILLFSMSVVSEERFREVAESLRMALIGSSSDAILDHSGNSDGDYAFEEYGDLSEFEDVDAGDLEPVESVMLQDTVPEEVLDLYETVTNYMQVEGLESDITLSRDQEGVYIDIQEAILFDPGSATLKTSGRETIGSLAGLFDLFDNEIIVEGYTDDIPMSNRRFPSNWELSVERAVSVLRYLSEEYSVEPTRLSARGYGEHHPVVPNDSRENRAQNRRVNIVIVHEHRKEDTNGPEE
ncbi:chemotaxis protein MotB [Alkalibacterium subtropicum]|uniref:Chemotaxis protein MotB n=1 Tax=Alkalibacterium subtropicum TaxID=753702 RepID=A0A1I1IW77_9LACT|nr:flagellar motor protein MotB [Alkalibacterium subtropicum]SFC40537.1 chemotaxis protein MotB [Alkalibacterium subtropicum]